MHCTRQPGPNKSPLRARKRRLFQDAAARILPPLCLVNWKNRNFSLRFLDQFSMWKFFVQKKNFKTKFKLLIRLKKFWIFLLFQNAVDGLEKQEKKCFKFIWCQTRRVAYDVRRRQSFKSKKSKFSKIENRKSKFFGFFFIKKISLHLKATYKKTRRWTVECWPPLWTVESRF